MLFRSRHLACLLLLLTTFGAAQAGSAQQAEVFRGRYIDVLLYRHAARAVQHAEATAAADQRSAATVAECQPLATVAAVWTMRPAAAAAASIHAITAYPRA